MTCPTACHVSNPMASAHQPKCHLLQIELHQWARIALATYPYRRTPATHLLKPAVLKPAVICTSRAQSPPQAGVHKQDPTVATCSRGYLSVLQPVSCRSAFLRDPTAGAEKHRPCSQSGRCGGKAGIVTFGHLSVASASYTSKRFMFLLLCMAEPRRTFRCQSSRLFVKKCAM